MPLKHPKTSSRAPHICSGRGVTRLLLVWAFIMPLQAQVPGPNVNMVSGTQWPGGDPFLQRQNEPSMAISSRNPLHMLAGANDYRTVDLPGVSGAAEPTGDSWLGLFKSFDGGQTWTSTLVPGYPQDTSLAGILSPLKGLGAGADPSVRAGTNGLFYYSGLAFNRQAGGASKVFVATFTDDNNVPGGDSIRFLWTIPVKTSTANTFEDKPSLAVDIPRANSTSCIVPTLPLQNTQIFRGGSVYVAWTEFAGTGEGSPARILFSRSMNCGLTWSAPKQISDPAITFNQGATVAIDPNNGNLYIAWRVFATTQPAQAHAIMYAASTDGGNTFSKATLVTSITPFDQDDSAVAFRTNAFPTMAVDAASHVYLAWSQRNAGPTGVARIMVVTGTPTPRPGTNPLLWSTAVAVDANTSPGHQIMPAMAFSAGKLTVAWYDLRNDDLLTLYTPQAGGQYSTSPVNDGGFPDFPAFGPGIQDPPGPTYATDARRQTLDVRAAQATPGNPPGFLPSVQVSQYAFGSTAQNPFVIQQLAVNPPNLPMFLSGTLAFFGDYIDVAGPTFIANHNGTWRYNNQPGDPDFTHVVWTDNRNVVPPADGNWANYTPPTYGTSTTSIFDPTQQRPACNPLAPPGNTGDRNQDIYTALLSPGLVVSAPGNAKLLGTGSNGKLIQREFPITVANTTPVARQYQITMSSQPVGGVASFLQAPVQTNPATPYPLTTITVQVPGLSSTSRSVFATSTDAHATVVVNVVELNPPNGNPPEAGSATINSDPANPPASSSSSSETYNTTISSPALSLPNTVNGSIVTPDVNANLNPYINPSIPNPSIPNPSIPNPSIPNPSIPNVAIADATWVNTATSNTPTVVGVNLVGQSPDPRLGVKLQLIIYKNYTTPLAQGCTLGVQSHFVPVANITDVSFATVQQLTQPAALNPSIPGVTLAPGETALITLRAYIPSPGGDTTQALAIYNPATQATPVPVSLAANTGTNLPPPSPLTILTKSLPPATLTVSYPAQTLQLFGGTGPYTWSLAIGSGPLPTGITLSTSGVISGTPTGTAGTASFTVLVTDAANNSALQPLQLAVSPNPPLIASPASGFSTISPLQLAGTSLAGAAITVFDSGTQVGTTTAIGTAFSVSVPLSPGAHSLTATQTVSSLTSTASAVVTVTIVPPAPLIASPASGFSTTSPLQLAGTSLAGAAITVFDLGIQVGTTTAIGTAFSVSVPLSVGLHSLTATQTVSSLTSAASAAVTGTIVPPAPLIASPASGFSTTSPLQVSGTSLAGAAITVFDGATPVGTTTAIGTAFSVSVPLSPGAHSLTATQTVNSITGAASTAVPGTIVNTFNVNTAETGTVTITPLGGPFQTTNAAFGFCVGPNTDNCGGSGLSSSVTITATQVIFGFSGSTFSATGTFVVQISGFTSTINSVTLNSGAMIAGTIGVTSSFPANSITFTGTANGGFNCFGGCTVAFNVQ